MRVLVTGATGFLGRALIPRLLEQPAQVVILARETRADGRLPRPLASLRSRFEVVYADLRNLVLTARAVRDAQPDHVIHLAAAGVTHPFLGIDTALRHNVTGTINLLRACFERYRLPGKLLLARSSGELESINVYAASKAAAWQFARMYSRTHGWPINGAMIFQAYGPGQPDTTLIPAALRAARAGHDFPMTAGGQQRDWIYVSDVVQGLMAVLAANLSPGTSLDLGTGQSTSVLDVVQLIYRLADQGGQPLPGRLPGRPGEDMRQVADVARSHWHTGWQAHVTLVEGIERLLHEAAEQ